MSRLTYRSSMGDYGLNGNYDKYQIWNKLGHYEDLDDAGKIERHKWKAVKKYGYPLENKYKYLFVLINGMGKPLVVEFHKGIWYTNFVKQERIIETNEFKVTHWFPLEYIIMEEE